MSKSQRIIFFVISILRNPHWHCTLYGTRFNFRGQPPTQIYGGPPSIGWPTWNLFYICRVIVRPGPGRESVEPPVKKMCVIYFNRENEMCMRIGKEVFVIGPDASKEVFTGHHEEHGEVVFYPILKKTPVKD